MNFNGLTSQEKRDPIVQRNMQIIDEVVRAFEQKQQLQLSMLAMQGSIAQSLAGGKKK